MANPATGTAAPTIWAFYVPQIGYPPIQQSVGPNDTYPQWQGEPFYTNNRGQIVQAYDSTGAQGAGEFIFLAGVASTVPGSVVTYDVLNNTTTLWTGTSNSGAPVAVAMSANNAINQMGWYQIAGAALVNVGTNATAGNPVFYGTSTGTVGGTTQASKQVEGATFLTTTTTASGLQATVLLNRPTVQGANS